MYVYIMPCPPSGHQHKLSYSCGLHPPPPGGSAARRPPPPPTPTTLAPPPRGDGRGPAPPPSRHGSGGRQTFPNNIPFPNPTSRIPTPIFRI